jgi:hypothetical protein
MSIKSIATSSDSKNIAGFFSEDPKPIQHWICDLWEEEKRLGSKAPISDPTPFSNYKVVLLIVYPDANHTLKLCGRPYLLTIYTYVIQTADFYFT